MREWVSSWSHKKFTTHFLPWELQKKQSLEVVSHILILSTFSSMCFLHKTENTRWLFIEKIIITTCNWLNIQCNWLFWKSNRLYYHFNWLKCSSQHLENFQEQCNWLDFWCNRLKCSWSLLGKTLRTKLSIKAETHEKPDMVSTELCNQLRLTGNRLNRN